MFGTGDKQDESTTAKKKRKRNRKKKKKGDGEELDSQGGQISGRAFDPSQIELDDMDNMRGVNDAPNKGGFNRASLQMPLAVSPTHASGPPMSSGYMSHR